MKKLTIIALGTIALGVPSIALFVPRLIKNYNYKRIEQKLLEIQEQKSVEAIEDEFILRKAMQIAMGRDNYPYNFSPLEAQDLLSELGIGLDYELKESSNLTYVVNRLVENNNPIKIYLNNQRIGETNRGALQNYIDRHSD